MRTLPLRWWERGWVPGLVAGVMVAWLAGVGALPALDRGLDWSRAWSVAQTTPVAVLTLSHDGHERAELTRVLRRLREAPPRGVGITLPLTTPHAPPELLAVEGALALATASGADGELRRRLETTRQALDYDAGLAEALRALPRVVLAAVPNGDETGFRAPHTQFVSENVQIGVAAPTPRLVFQDGETQRPALALSLFAALTGSGEPQLRGDTVYLGNLQLPAGPEGRVEPFPAREILHFPASDWLEGRIDPARLRQSALIITRDDTGQAQLLAALPGRYRVTPPWGHWAGLAAALFMGMVVMGVLPLLSVAAMSWIIILLAGVLAATPWVAFTLGQWALPLAAAWVWLLLGAWLLFCRAGWLTYRRATFATSGDAEQWRLQGLAAHGQGELEKAFELFSRCPADGLILGLLYNLGLDFERRKQEREALAVYRYLASQEPDYRDIQSRIERITRPRKPRLNGGGRISDWLEDISETHKPQLGRYQIERKLSKGAMGVVYLGKDPKLDRMVAIKTLALGEEFEGEELEEATARFFREAGAAGRLSHPYIIQVYDAGEANDLAYISMEFFKGGDLSPYTKPDNPLPLDAVLEVMLKACEALDYAHRQGVIHRDIKPANILYNRASGLIKLTDFGIARVTDSNRTKTGVVLGTPSYMSPEQLAGKHLDGRTDLFSLGVMFYQLLTGTLPFSAESMASLMFKIASEPHPAIASLRADVPSCIARVVDRLLEKNPTARFVSGGATAQALRDCQALFRTTTREPAS